MEFEKKIKELENISEKLGSGELSLEDSLKFFEKGIKISRECLKQLNKAEEKAQQLINITTDGKVLTKDFPTDPIN